jgi:hypothetical protein
MLYVVYLQELLYLYGFVVDNNPDDYLMVTFTMMYVLKDNNFIGHVCHLAFSLLRAKMFVLLM